ncbi:MAG: hypothetical protein RLZZ500_969, partial [Bacteroidota bacterium]
PKTELSYDPVSPDYSGEPETFNFFKQKKPQKQSFPMFQSVPIVRENLRPLIF